MKSFGSIIVILLSIAILSTILVSGMVLGCTENSRAKNFGGTSKIALPLGQKLINATWKDAQLWYLTRQMRSDEKPEMYTFQEKSNFGMMEGTVIFTESR